jgi:AraC-like DNA-binding protein
VDEAPDDEARVALMDEFLTPLWRQVRPDAASPVRVYADWSRNLALRASVSGWGRSLRQVERRIKQWTGQPLRELRGMGRSEQAFFDAVVAGRSGEVNWSDVASSSGYADQSHLCRQSRRVTGFPPPSCAAASLPTRASGPTACGVSARASCPIEGSDGA